MEEGDTEKLPGTAGTTNVTVSPADRLHSLTLTLTRTLAPTRATARSRAPGILHRTPQAGTYTCHLHRGQLSPSQQQPPPPPAALGSSHPPAGVRAGRPSPPPSALLLGVFTTFPPGQWRTLGDEPEGTERGGVHASPAFFLQRTLYMVVRGRVKVAPALRLLPRPLRLLHRPLRSPPPPRAAATTALGSCSLSGSRARCSRRRRRRGRPYLVFVRLPHPLDRFSAPAVCRLFFPSPIPLADAAHDRHYLELSISDILWVLWGDRNSRCSTPVACPSSPATLKNSEKVASSLPDAEEVATR